MIYNGDGQASNNDMYGIKTAVDVSGTKLYKTVSVTAIAAGILEDIVFAYGYDEEIGGNARLFLNKADLAAIGKLRDGDNHALYKIIPRPRQRQHRPDHRRRPHRALHHRLGPDRPERLHCRLR